MECASSDILSSVRLHLAKQHNPLGPKCTNICAYGGSLAQTTIASFKLTQKLPTLYWLKEMLWFHIWQAKKSYKYPVHLNNKQKAEQAQQTIADVHRCTHRSSVALEIRGTTGRSGEACLLPGSRWWGTAGNRCDWYPVEFHGDESQWARNQSRHPFL